MVELALALPVLLIMFLGLVELGFLMRAHLVVVNACREAARFGSRGTFTDEEIAGRAIDTISPTDERENDLLPIQFAGPDANTQIVVTRFRVPAKGAAVYNPSYITGTLGLESEIDPDAYALKLKEETDKFNADLENDKSVKAVPTGQDVIVVEIFYYHYEVLHAPIVEWFFPDPMVVYSRTVMRISEGRIF
jgi:hypothetical protein